MSNQNSYRLIALGRSYDLPRVYLNKEERFTESKVCRSDAGQSSSSINSSSKHRRPLLLPTSPFEVEVMNSEGVLDEASWVTDTLLLVVDELPVSGTERVKDLRAEAVKKFEDDKLTKNQKYDRYTRERFGKSYSDLVNESRRHVIDRFKAAFENVLYVPEMQSWRPPGVRDIVMGYEIAADRKVISELVELAGCGHVHSQYLAALLLCFTDEGLTQQSVKLLLQAHENKHPQALNALGRLLLAQDDYVGAIQAALVAMQGQYRDAKNTVELVQRALTMIMVQTPDGLVPAFAALLDVLDSKYLDLARRHFPEWFPSEDERAEAFFRRFARGGHHV